MIKHTENEIKVILHDILTGCDFEVAPIGNHHLKRHQVYKIIFNDGGKLIFKLYYITGRRAKEIACLRLLEKSEVKAPKIYAQGISDHGNEWLLLTYVEGDLLDNYIGKIPKQREFDLFTQIGEELGKLHSIKIFDFFGSWDNGGQDTCNMESYNEYFMNKMEERIEVVLNKDLPDKDILLVAIEEIRRNYKKLNTHVIPRLTHGDFDGRNILVTEENEAVKINGIIDFEMGFPDNSENDLISLYFRYLLFNKEYERAFLNGYDKYIAIDSGFYDRLYLYLLAFAVRNCSWSLKPAPDYYSDNIKFLKKIIKTAL